MAGPRATWKGVLKIALVQIPIKVYPATEPSEPLHFNQLHTLCVPPTRVTQKRWCATCDREVLSAEIVKGYEFEKGRYVLLLEAELEAVRPASARVIDLVQFVSASALDPVLIDRSYYLTADGPTGTAALLVMRAAMSDRDRVGIGKLAIYGREYLVAVRPTTVQRQRVILLHTLHHEAELREAEAIDAMQTAPALDHVRLADRMITSMTGPLDLATFQDQYQTDLRTLIDAKIAGQEIVQPSVPASPAVLKLADALTRSLELVSAAKPPRRVNKDGSRRKRTA